MLQYRFMLMCLAALEAPLNLPVNGSLYGEEVTFVANDWHAALVPVYLASKYRPHGVYTSARSILAIHNLRHQVGSGLHYVRFCVEDGPLMQHFIPECHG